MASREHEMSAQPWGTLEELLLVCAVNRHGTRSWDSVASELQSSRPRTTTTVLLLTPHDCKDKFHDLKPRFENDAVTDDDDGADSAVAFMVDELRRLRVEELRRRDVSIVSLESKVKNMEEERDRSLTAAEAETPSPKEEDLHRDGGGDGGGGGGERSELPERHAGKSNSGDDFVSDSSERENRSFNESNSTSQRSDAEPNGVVVKKKSDVDVKPGLERNQSDPVQAQTRSKPPSANGKVIDDDDVDNNNDREAGGGAELTASRPGEFDVLKQVAVKAVAATKQNSDVQSSASLSRKRKRRRKGGESSSGEEPEGGEEVSPATTKRVKIVKLEPLVKFLRASHRLGSVFQRRLRSQESQRYKNLIREHVDLHVVQSRLDKEVFKDCTHKFFRDLLLIFSNAVVFYRKTAPEHVAALELRSLVLKEMNDHLPRPKPAVSTSTSMKPNKSSGLVACGKRGSINALSENKKGNVRKVEVKVEDAAPVKVEEKGVRKRRSTQESREEGGEGRGRQRQRVTARM